MARFADIGDDFNLDPASASELAGPATRAVMPVHLYGLPAPMAEVMAMAARLGLAVVEDAAQAVGARYQGQPAGSFGVGCFSLYATKNVTTGEGGVVTTGDFALAERLRILRNQGMRAKYDYVMAGHNYRLTDLQAALGVAQMARLAEINEARRRNAAILGSGLSGISGLVLPGVPADREHVFHQYTVRVTPDAPRTAEELATALAERGIGTGRYYPRLVHDYEVYRHHRNVRLDPTPRAARAATEVLSLPVHPNLTAEHLERIVAATRAALGS